MSPFVSPWTALLPDRRWLALVILPAVSALGLTIGAARPPPGAMVRARTQVQADEPDPLARLRRLARRHRSWVAEHGAGCARSIWYLVEHTDVLVPEDRWGMPLVLTCDRSELGKSERIEVRVISSGPDRVRGTSDDLVGRDVQTLSP